MSMFYFDCFDGVEHLVDDLGIELSTDDEAREHAVTLAQSLLADGIPSGEIRVVAVAVRASSGAMVYMAHCGFTGCWAAAGATAHRLQT